MTRTSLEKMIVTVSIWNQNVGMGGSIHCHIGKRKYNCNGSRTNTHSKQCVLIQSNCSVPTPLYDVGLVLQFFASQCNDNKQIIRGYVILILLISLFTFKFSVIGEQTNSNSAWIVAELALNNSHSLTHSHPRPPASSFANDNFCAMKNKYSIHKVDDSE